MTESVEDLNFDLGNERVDLLLLTKCFQCLSLQVSKLFDTSVIIVKLLAL